MKRNFLFKVSLSCFLVLVFVLGILLYLKKSVVKHPLTSKDKKIQITVKEGQNLKDVIKELGSEKLLTHSYVTQKYVQQKYASLNIKVGVYSFSENIPLEKMLRYLNTGIRDDEPVKVVIPEGYDIENIASILDKKGVINKEEFITNCKQYKIAHFVKNDTKRKYLLEGYLFPDTYEFLKGTSGEDIIKTMLDRFSNVITSIEKETGKNITDEELDKTIIMASIVEKEVEKNDERKTAASVFYNRINKGMKLQSCATVLYALGVHKNKLYYNDLKINSPYNTYIVKGLPEGPICCPGKQCIMAAINPEKTNYLYFVSKNDGTHFFTDDEKKFQQVKKVTQGE